MRDGLGDMGLKMSFSVGPNRVSIFHVAGLRLRILFFQLAKPQIAQLDRDRLDASVLRTDGWVTGMDRDYEGGAVGFGP